MNTLHIDTWSKNDCTIGRLRFGVFHCWTLELPWIDNEQDISCILAGEYEGEKFQSFEHGEVIRIKDVPNRTLVDIHAGNFTRDILGCILTGDGVKDIDQDSIPDVTNSVKTLRKLLARLPDKFMVKITRVFSPEVS